MLHAFLWGFLMRYGRDKNGFEKKGLFRDRIQEFAWN